MVKYLIECTYCGAIRKLTEAELLMKTTKKICLRCHDKNVKYKEVHVPDIYSTNMNKSKNDRDPADNRHG